MATTELHVLDTTRIFADYGRNVRQAWKYRVEPKENFNPEKDTPGFYEDIVLRGVQVHIEVVKLTVDQKARILAKFGVDADYRVVRGHRRFKAVEIARKSNPELFKTLTCVVYIGLSEVEEIKLMCDHSGTEPLNEFEEFQSVERLFGTALSQEAIGLQIGRKRAWVQDRIYLLELSQYIPEIRESYSKSFEPTAVKFKDFVPFTWKDVDAMHKAWAEDVRAKIAADSPESKTAGLWRALKDQTGKAESGPKALTRAKMEEKSGLLKGRDALELAHGFYNGDGRSLMDAIEAYDALAAKAKLAESLKVEVAELKTQVADLTRLVAERDATIASLQAELTTAKAPKATARKS